MCIRDSLEAIVKHLDIPTSLKEFGVPAEDLEGLVESGTVSYTHLDVYKRQDRGC